MSAEHAEIQRLRAQLQQQHQEFTQQMQQAQQAMQAAAAQSASSAPAPAATIVMRAPELPKIRQPSSFNGAMGFAVDDWISEMQQQFAYYGTRFPDDATKISYAVAYFTGPAMHWWESQPACTGWAAFVQRLHDRFRPVHAAMLARQKLGKLRQRGGQSVNQYVGVFQNTLTPITDMGAMDQVHHFVNGLLAPIAAKVWEKHPKTLVDAIDAAVSVEAMHNFGRAAVPFNHRSGHVGGAAPSSTPNPDAMDLNNLEFDSEEVDGRDSTAGTAQNGQLALMAKMVDQMAAMEMRLNAIAGKGYTPRSDNSAGRSPSRDYIDGLDASTIKKLQAEGKCFRCKKQGHMKNECPQKPKNE
jgi:hypothetical protein